MNKNNLEIEFKINISEPKKLRKWLKEIAKFHFKTFQKDEYFQPPHRDFLIKERNDALEWLRIRTSDKGNGINYKNWHEDGSAKSNYCDEYEVGIDNIDNMKAIFKALGYRDFFTLEKEREIWTFQDLELAVDKITGLNGLFVDVEYKGNSDMQPNEIAQGMIDKLKTLEIGKWRKAIRGYIYMILNPTKEHYESVD